MELNDHRKPTYSLARRHPESCFCKNTLKQNYRIYQVEAKENQVRKINAKNNTICTIKLSSYNIITKIPRSSRKGG